LIVFAQITVGFFYYFLAFYIASLIYFTSCPFTIIVYHPKDLNLPAINYISCLYGVYWLCPRAFTS